MKLLMTLVMKNMIMIKTAALPASHVTSSPGVGSSDHLCPPGRRRPWRRRGVARCLLGTESESRDDQPASTRSVRRVTKAAVTTTI